VNLDPTQIMLLMLLVSVGADKALIFYQAILLARKNGAPATQPALPAGPIPTGPVPVSPGGGGVQPPAGPDPPAPPAVVPPVVVLPPAPPAPPVVVVPPTAPVGPSKVLRGKCSYFGGPHDTGVAADEGLALIERSDFGHGQFGGLFLPTQPEGTTGLARALNPDAHYIACRWDYSETSKKYLQSLHVTVKNPTTGEVASDVRPVDWGPNAKTGRIADLSPGLMAYLKLNTDDVVEVDIPLPGSGPVVPVVPGVPTAPPVTPSSPVAGAIPGITHTTYPSQDEAHSYFGSPGSNLVKVTCPWLLTVEGTHTQSITINAKCAASFMMILNAIWNHPAIGQSQDKINEWGYNIFDGSFNDRLIAGTSTTSQHAWGAALDFNADKNPQHAPISRTLFKPDSLIVQAFKQAGWTWGGDWSPRYIDAMHFQMLKA
jgi:D-alanyl-D-alanine carboxypeptidase